MAVDVVDDLPAVCFEAFRCIVGEPAIDLAVNGDIVVVVEANQLAELERPGQRAGLVRNAFHEATVTKEHPGLVMDNVVSRPVELGGQHLLTHGHANGIRDALAQRTRGCLDRTARLEFRVACRLVAHLPEVLQLVDGEILVASQVQQAVKQHRAMAIGQHEAVAIRPLRIGRVVFEIISPQDFGDIRHPHRGAGVTRVRRLDGIHAQCSDRIREDSPVSLAGTLCLM
jgi:hypothetical protein